ncbi:hypothetical protein VTI28DRAFT_10035 [Corynascus sepedonium]
MAENWTAYLQTLEGHSNNVISVARSHDATRLASASDDRTVKIWDPATGHCVSTLEDNGSMIRSVAWSHDPTRLVLALKDRKVKIWNPATVHMPQTWPLALALRIVRGQHLFGMA